MRRAASTSLVVLGACILHASTARSDPPAEVAATACPVDMVEVEGDFCPDLEQTCIRRPREMSYRCLEYEASGPCKTETTHKRYCMDRYEWPNKAGEMPVVMKSWFDAKAACEGAGKRLCTQDEWTLACEGPDHLPYPYGQARDATACNIDKPHPAVDEKALKNPLLRDAEVARLWQGEPSGSRDRCVSPFGVHDMTGNVDEWTVNETGKPHRSALKGGYWSWVRGRCRAVTPGHDEFFKYYQIGWRCCAEVRAGAPSGARITPRIAGSSAPATPAAGAEATAQASAAASTAASLAGAAAAAAAAAAFEEATPPRVVAPRIVDTPQARQPSDAVRGPQKGAIDVPGSAAGHRVFVDGKVARATPGVVVVDCGTHVAKIGHDGREQTVDVPCGGRVKLEFP